MKEESLREVNSLLDLPEYLYAFKCVHFFQEVLKKIQLCHPGNGDLWCGKTAASSAETYYSVNPPAGLSTCTV